MTPEITPAPSFTTDISEVKFDSKEAGYKEAPAAVTINVSNTGNVKLTGIAVSVSGNEFTVSAPSASELEANANQSVSLLLHRQLDWQQEPIHRLFPLRQIRQIT